MDGQVSISRTQLDGMAIEHVGARVETSSHLTIDCDQDLMDPRLELQKTSRSSPPLAHDSAAARRSLGRQSASRIR